MTTFLLDGRALQDASSVRGIGTYARGLLAGLAAIGAAGDVALLLRRDGGLPPEVSSHGVRDAGLRLPIVSRRLQPLLDPLLVGRAVRRLQPTLYHGLEYGQPLRSRVPVVITVHDLIPFMLPHHYPWMRRERLLALRLLRSADAILADSASTMRDLVSVARVRPDRVTVVFPAVSATFRPRPDEHVDAVLEKRGIQPPYVLAVGTFDPRKRVKLLMQVMALVRRHHNIALVIAGDQGNFEPPVVAAVERARLSASTHLLGHVPEDDLIALYTGAACLVFTSAYEGFGLPVLEAMACGAPVVSFDNSSLPEVAGSAGILLPDGDATAMAGAISGLLDDSAEAARRREDGLAWASRFTWERTAQETLAVYRALIA